jgi:hypothetical protein
MRMGFFIPLIVGRWLGLVKQNLGGKIKPRPFKERGE